MTNKWTALITCLLAVWMLNAQAQTTGAGYWMPTAETTMNAPGVRQIVPQWYQTWGLSPDIFQQQLSAAPLESQVSIQTSSQVISLPDPSGIMQEFRVVESPIMEAELGARFPHIRTYSLKGITDPYANGKMDWNDFGLHVSIRTPRGDYFIDPYTNATRKEYIVYYTEDFQKSPDQIIPEAGVDHGEAHSGEESGESEIRNLVGAKTAGAVCVGDRLRTYRLAVACTGEYAQAATGMTNPSVSQVLSKIVTTVNRVNSVYESEVAIRLVLISNNTQIIFTDPATDPFNGNNSSVTLISESQTVIGGTIGSGNYDIGHTFSTGGGGLANLGCVCTSGKARGITGSPSPVGDPYDIDYVAHEIGHQFGANHTFNSTTGSCSGNRNGSTSMEPGSGITIMAYAGLCGGANNLGPNSIPYFHAISYDEIVTFTHTGAGNNCASPSTTGNNAPVVEAPVAYTIPKITPFELRGSATDADGDSLTYSWEAFDRGLAAGNWNSGAVPYFRSYAPDTIPYRMFPKLSVVLGGSTTGIKGEYYPQSAQTLNFRLAARDGKMGGGGVCYAATQVVVANAGPFKVTDPNVAGITWYQGAWPVVTWDVAGTDAAPVLCEKVNILISTDGGFTFFPVVTDTENDGVASVPVPPVSAPVSTCRLRIECAGNIFFDINDFNFSISDIVSNDPLAGTLSPALNTWPNPAGNAVTIRVEQENWAERCQISLMDLTGKILHTETFSGMGFQTDWSLSSWPDGVYLIQAETENGKSVQKLIKSSVNNP